MRALPQEFFDATVKHRRLTWFYALGSATLRGNFRAKPIDISCLPTQAAVCLLFNAGARAWAHAPCRFPLLPCKRPARVLSYAPDRLSWA
jgi:hypothetical protein